MTKGRLPKKENKNQEIATMTKPSRAVIRLFSGFFKLNSCPSTKNHHGQKTEKIVPRFPIKQAHRKRENHQCGFQSATDVPQHNERSIHSFRIPLPNKRCRRYHHNFFFRDNDNVIIRLNDILSGGDDQFYCG